MNRFMRFLAPAVITCTLLLSASASRAADTENPEYKSWSGQKVGTVAKWHMTVNAAGNKTEMDRAAKLVELTPDHAVIEESSVMEVGGNKINTPGQKRTIAAKGAGAVAAQPNATATPNASVKESEETLEAGGKSYKCKAVASSSTANGMKSESKVWTCPEVPGLIVKMTSVSEGAMKSDTTMTLTGIEAAK